MEPLNERLWQILQEMITTYGTEICQEPGRLEGLLRDQCGQYRREIRLLIDTVKEGVVTELRSGTPSVPLELLIPKLCKKIEQNLMLSPDAAEWAVKSWAAALGLSPSWSASLPTKENLARVPRSSRYDPGSSPASQKTEGRTVRDRGLRATYIVLITIALAILAALWLLFARVGSNWLLILCIPVSIVGTWAVVLWAQQFIRDIKK